MVDDRWQSAHLYYYDEHKNDLLLDCIQMLFRHPLVSGKRPFWVRHWLRGPHIRLRFFCSDAAFATEVKPCLELIVGDYLKQRPSQVSLSEAQLRPTYETLAQQEREVGPLFPLYPDNSIQYIPYDSRLHVLESPQLAATLEDFYVDTDEITFAMLDTIRGGGRLLSLCFDLMVVVAHLQGQHITRGFISYRSHAEGFIISTKQPQAVRALFEQQYQAQAEQFCARLRVLLGVLERKEDTIPFVQQWATVMQHYWERSEDLLHEGALAIALENDGSETETHAGHEFKRNLQRSAFHSNLESDPERKRALYTDSWFLRYRLMLNLLYLHFSRLGLRPLDRFLLCHLMANSVEHTFNISAVAFMTQHSA